MKLAAGDTVTIKVKNPVWVMRKAYASYIDVPEYNTYTGRIIVNHKAIRPGQIGLTTDQKDFDMRVIDVNRIVGFEDSVMAVPVLPEIKTWTVEGSKGKTYTVTLEYGRYTCTCPGFQFRHNCKHVDDIKRAA